MTDRERKRLEKMLFYVLARRPDEFGLLLDPSGFVRLKDLHRALVEVDGFKGLRCQKLRNFFLVFKPERFEFDEQEDRVRVRPEEVDSRVFSRKIAESPPKTLFTPVRPRAWIKVSEEGLAAQTIVLTPDRDLAERLARRRGALVIEVDTRKAMEMGSVFESYLEKLYLSSWIPADALRGPRVNEEFKKKYERKPKEKTEDKKLEEEKIVLVEEPVIAFRKLTKGRKKDPEWKRARRRARRR